MTSEQLAAWAAGAAGTFVVAVLGWSIKELVEHGKLIAMLKAQNDAHGKTLETLTPMPAVMAALKEAVDTLKAAVDKLT